MEFVWGNEDRLEGYVNIYSEYTLRDPKPIFLVNVTATPHVLFHNAELEEAETKIETEIATTCRLMEKSIDKRNYKLFETFSLIGALAAAEEEIPDISNELLFTGRYNRKQDCLKAVQEGMEYYLQKFYSQMFKKHVDNKEGVYWKINGKGIKKHISGRYITPMLKAVKKKDDEDYWSLKHRFRRFSEGAPFELDIFRLCKLIEVKAPKRLIKAYVNKITAIHEQDYETAAKMRDKIAKMNNGRS